MARLIASFFGSGLVLGRLRSDDAGSGTVGSLLALAIALAVRPVGLVAQLALLVAAIIATLISVPRLSDSETDPAWVVIDEAAGTFLATLGLGVVAALVAWVVFRLADIFKNAFPGVARAERQFPGAVGVLADDLVAGLYGLAAGWLATAVF